VITFFFEKVNNH